MSNMEDEVKIDAKIFFRFLKEEGIFSSFLRYFNNPAVFNQVRENYPNKNIYFFIRCYHATYLITILINWSRTYEGHDFWQSKHDKFFKYYNEHANK